MRRWRVPGCCCYFSPLLVLLRYNRQKAVYNFKMYSMAQTVKCLPAMWATRARSLAREDPLEKEMATHSSTLAWKIPWTEEPCRQQSMGSQRVRHDWVTSVLHHSLKFSEHRSSYIDFTYDIYLCWLLCYTLRPWYWKFVPLHCLHPVPLPQRPPSSNHQSYLFFWVCFWSIIDQQWFCLSIHFEMIASSVQYVTI